MESNSLWHFKAAVRFAWLFTLVLLFAPSLRAANTCPWMNEATASGLLGGDAVGAYQSSSGSGQPATCTFTQQTGNATRTLIIQVTTTPDAAGHLRSTIKSCSSNATRLQAIGNEAVQCASNDRGVRLEEEVVGRVRDQVFLIRMSSSLKSDPFLTRSALEVRTSSAAEQVSGNLF